MELLRRVVWVLANIYGRVAGRRWLASFHHALLLFSLHGLGYDNGLRDSFTGEHWFIRNVLKRANIRIALDIGANVGVYSRMLRAELDCEVHAFEPSSAAFAQLSKSTDQRIHAYQTAIADQEGTATLYAKQPASPTASLHAGIGGPNAEPVPVTTIDAFCVREGITAVDFVKIDTEGYEREVLHGMRETIARLQPRYVQFEFNIMHLRRGYTVYDLSQLLPGYSLYRLLPRGWLPIVPNQFINNIFMFSNVVAVRGTKE